MQSLRLAPTIPRVMLAFFNKPIRTVMRWQFIASVVLALPTVLLNGSDAAVSVLLGGAVGMVGAAVYALTAGFATAHTASNALRGLLRAEAAKITAVVLLLWLVMTKYQNVVAAGVIGSFVIATMLFSAAIFIRDDS